MRSSEATATYVSIAFSGQSWGFEWQGIPKTLEVPSCKVSPQTWLNKKPSSLGKRIISVVFTHPRSEPLSVLKNKVLKNA